MSQHDTLTQAWHYETFPNLGHSVLTSPAGERYELRSSDLAHPRALAAFSAMLAALSATQPAQAGEAVTVTGKLGDICTFRSTSVRKGDKLYPAPPASQEWRDTLTVNLLRNSRGLTKTQIRELIDAAVSGRLPDESLFTPASQEQAEWTDADSDAARLALELECLLLDTKDTAAVSRWWSSALEALELHRARINASQEQAQQPSLICRTCGADRFKEPCKNSTTCTMVGEAQAQQPTPASAADMAVYQSIADGYLNAQQPSTSGWIESAGNVTPKLDWSDADMQQPSGGEVVKPLFAASVAARKWAELQADGHRMQSIAFDGGKGGPGTITPWGKVVWGAAPKPEPMTAEQIVAIAATPCAIPGSYVYSLVRAIEAHHDITGTSTKGEA